MSNTPKRRRKPARTVEDKENELINKAVALADQQLTDGTAPTAVIIHYLRLGTAREQLEREKIKHENLLLETKVKTMEAAEQREQDYAEAIKAMTRYKGENFDQHS